MYLYSTSQPLELTILRDVTQDQDASWVYEIVGVQGYVIPL